MGCGFSDAESSHGSDIAEKNGSLDVYFCLDYGTMDRIDENITLLKLKVFAILHFTNPSWQIIFPFILLQFLFDNFLLLRLTVLSFFVFPHHFLRSKKLFIFKSDLFGCLKGVDCIYMEDSLSPCEESLYLC